MIDVNWNRQALRRWLDVVVYGIMASIAWVMIAPWVGEIFDPLVSRASKLGALGVWKGEIIVASPFVLLLIWLGRGRIRAFLNCRHPLSYPNLGVAVGVAYVLQQALLGVPTWATSFAILLGAIFVCLLASNILQPFQTPELTEPVTEHQKLDTYEAIRAWVKDDGVASADHVLFGHDLVARRIARRLRETHPATIAIVGEAGSGKSTIKECTRRHLASTHDIEIVDISMWPFFTADAAVAGVLDALVAALRQHVGTISLQGVSDEYVELIARSSGPLESFMRAVNPKRSPEQVLKQIAHIATAINVRFVLWIEDMERFAGSNDHLLGPIRALLYLLDKSDWISVVIADTSLRSSFDLQKLARYIEHPPAPSEHDVARILDLVREQWRSATIIDPVESRKPWAPSDYTIEVLGLTDEVRSVQRATVLLTRTPRALKQGIRLAIDTWETLAGEIDSDDVLVASILRISRPEVFAFIEHNIEPCRAGFKKLNDKVHSAQEVYKALLDAEPTKLHREAVAAIVRGLLPAIESKFSGHDRSYIAKPQGLFVARHVDYFQRYLACALGSEIPDQVALGEIESWKKTRHRALLTRFVELRDIRQIQTFVGRFTRSQLVDLVEDVTMARLDIASRAPNDINDDGVVAVWQMCDELHPDREMLTNRVERLIKRSAGVDLVVAHSLDSFFQGSLGNLITQDGADRFTIALADGFAEAYLPSNIEAAAAALKGASEWTLFHVVRRFQGSTRWNEFAGFLIELARARPAIGLGPVSALITSTGRGEDPGVDDDGDFVSRTVYRSTFLEDKARELFDFEELIDVLAAQETPPQVTDQQSSMITAAVEFAKSYK